MNRTGVIASRWRRWAGAVLVVLAAAGLMAPTVALAQEQVAFASRNTGQGRTYSYKLRDEYTKAIASVSFTVRRDDLEDVNQGLTSMATAEKKILPDLLARGNQRCDEIARKYKGLAHCTVTETNSGPFQIVQHFSKGVDRGAVESDVKRLMSELMALHDQLLSRYSFQVTGSGQNRTFGLDYAAVAKRAVDAMVPVARAVKSADLPIAGTTNGRRIALSRAIAFMQAIPYEALGAQRSTGLGFLPPVALIDENKGDCDSKSVAYAAIARTLAPGTPVAIIVVPGHALVGLGIATQPGDVTITFGGLTYVLAEPVGPAPAHIGQIGPISEAALKNKSKINVVRVF